MADSRETFSRRAFVSGHPIAHSRSPLIHGHWLRAFDIDGAYIARDVAPDNFANFIRDLRSGQSGFVGGNGTLPHKEAAFALADRPDDLAQELGAANTLWVENGKVLATNTDVHGFAANLDAGRPGWDKGKRAVVFGAGGAARAVIRALRDRGFTGIHVVNRTAERAQELADRFGPGVSAHPQDALAEVMAGADLFVNTAAVGMNGRPAPDIDFSPLASGALVTDIVYVPLVTPFLAKAKAQGFATVDGLGMLLHQAVPGFETWFGRRPEVDEALRDLIIADMDAHR